MSHSVYAQLLTSAPGSCGDIRKELEAIHGLTIPGSTYSSIWKSLVNCFGTTGAPKIVEDVVDIRVARHTLLRVGRCKKWEVDLLLIDRINKARKNGRQKLRSENAINEPKPDAATKKRKHIINHDHIALPSVDYGSGLRMSQAIAYCAIEQIKNDGSARLKARSNWLEINLENYIEKYWSNLDFGLGKTLQLCGRQAHLSATREKVDLLASSDEIVLPIELKIKRAGGSDLTQLQSYRQDLIDQGYAPENVLGILVAPQFSSKVLNVVRGGTGVILRWFESPM